MGSSSFGGRCLCGAVAYAFSAPPRVTVMCHCSQCRRVTGSAFGTWALVPKEYFRWLSGTEAISEFASSETGQRLFCRQCGTTLASLSSRRPAFVHVAAGTLDAAPELKLAFHAYVASKAPWFEIADALPQHADEPGKRG